MSGYEFDTGLPTKTDQDLITLSCMLLEKYELRFPEVEYYSLLIPEVSQSGTITPDPNPATKIDDLYGEDIPYNMASDFVQPHTTPTLDATRGRRYADSITLNVKVNFESKQKDMDKRGVDKSHDISFKFLSYQLERKNVRLKPGDQFFWRDTEYEILRVDLRGRWHDTDYFLYREVYTKVKSKGS